MMTQEELDRSCIRELGRDLAGTSVALEAERENSRNLRAMLRQLCNAVIAGTEDAVDLADELRLACH